MARHLLSLLAMKAANTRILRYVLALAACGTSTLLAFALSNYLAGDILLLYVPAVVSAAWFGGLGPGLAATFCSVALTTFFFLDPRYSFAVTSAEDLAQLAVFSSIAFLISLLDTAQKRAQRDLLASQEMMKLVFDVTRAANEAETLDQAYGYAIRRIGEEHPWVYAHLYLPERDSPRTLVPSVYFHTKDRARFREVRARSLSRPLLPGAGVAGRSFSSGSVEWDKDLRRDLTLPPNDLFLAAGARTVAAFPVRIGSEVLGVFEFFSTEWVSKNDALIHLMGVLGLELGRVVERQRLQEGYSEAVWEQQRVIAQELHDGLGQELTGLGFLSQSLTDLLKDPESASRAIRLTQGLQRALEQIRGLAKGVSPVAPEPEGLATALSQFAESIPSTYGVTCRFEGDPAVLVDQNAVAVHLYRIAQEAVTNAAKHGKPAAIVIRLRRTPKGVELSVTDDGTGLPEDRRRGNGSGLRIMRYRAHAIGASLQIGAVPSGGTSVTCLLADGAGHPAPTEVPP